MRRALLILAASAPWACASRWGAALDAWHDGRAPEAAGRLRELEPEARQGGASALSRYALYRGLVELSLGNAGAAGAWLGRARSALARDPSLFDERERGELAAAWRSMGHMPGDER